MLLRTFNPFIKNGQSALKIKILLVPVKAVKLPATTVTKLPFPFDENELELWNVEFWQLKKTSVKTLQIELYPVFFKCAH